MSDPGFEARMQANETGFDEVGRIRDAEGRLLRIGRRPDGVLEVLIRAVPGAPARRRGVIRLDARARDELRELLDRAAMPGQVSG